MSRSRILYSVTATLPDEATAREYIDWLLTEHVSAVVSAGKALSGRVIRVLDPKTPLRIESHYVFATTADYEHYLATHANRLRNEGLIRFPASKGLTFERRICEILGEVEPRPGQR